MSEKLKEKFPTNASFLCVKTRVGASESVVLKLNHKMTSNINVLCGDGLQSCLWLEMYWNVQCLILTTICFTTTTVNIIT